MRTTIQNFDTAIQKGDLADAAQHHLRRDRRQLHQVRRHASGTTSTPGSPPPGSTRWSPASTRSSSTATTPRPTSRRSWRSIRRPGRRAASIWSSATSSGRSARPPQLIQLSRRRRSVDPVRRACVNPHSTAELGSQPETLPARAVQVVAGLDDALGHRRPRPSSGSCAGRRPSCCRPRRRPSARRRSW